MKKIDSYTKIILTIIAIAQIGHLIKDSNIITKAHASEINLSTLKIEDTRDSEGTTFFIYENNKLEKPFSKEPFSWDNCEIRPNDIPIYIITNKKINEGPFGERYTKINRRR